jgi:hypothetical protein
VAVERDADEAVLVGDILGAAVAAAKASCGCAKAPREGLACRVARKDAQLACA